MWKNLLVEDESYLTYKNYVDKVFSSNVYKVTPKKIKWFNEELDDEEYILEM
jgi:hypothetical protein